MNIGLIGLGKMGFNLAENLLDHNYSVTAFDLNVSAVEKISAAGALGVKTIADLAASLPSPRVIWVMVPSGKITEDVILELSEQLEEGDIIIEGGNSHYQDTKRRAAELKTKGIHYLDVGTSGGTSGARNGACMMIGGDKDVFTSVEGLFRDICVENGYLYTGEIGSGHFLKMVHNGIEYGMMQSIAEGFELLEKSEFNFDHEQVAKVWNNGSVIRSWLMELTQNAFSKDPKLESIKGVMHSSGEGKWTLETALDLQVAMPVTAMSLMMRYRSLEEDTFTGKVVASLRNEFGGHSVEKK
ncbi:MULTISPECIES: phosphogluconate dehydrogenase (NAD(+)-dependent, decarboxylating) [unclassified Niallia]|uniref:phosphogluconate dehydrogenase (NAD(+)-dependent, decarboxylating) n=1 Tax=unclassified Niallia TaxID=2837522 RepID=UPI001EDB20F8|nr:MULTISPECIES: decarboxylating 6-phosphogluconate dehydrogenase [unclassified Niallia]MDL0434529.1 decarboxylating 6-phosphogluconate dehydrogenase [Niallia sp. SS-2023]UPO88501.1 decarboxylating 6-phosphogluconate dehydrogenase [Niallia sp. Man26]